MMNTVNSTFTFTNLYKGYRQDLLAYAFHRCGDKAIAEDLIQEVFLKLWIKRDELNAIKNIRSYLFIMTRNETVNFLQRQGLYQKILNSYGQWFSHSTTHDPLLENEYRERLLRAIAKLPAQQSLVYELRCVYNWKVSKVAAAMDISPFTVKNHLRRVRRKLLPMVA